MNIR
ncbi:hypothetical protein CLOP_g19829, partial [Closterium sp. NIES-67]|jgi:hypothetical protein